MPEQRRRFSPQFKAEAVQLVVETGKPIAEVARDLGIHDGTLGNWVNAWCREHPEPDQPVNPMERAPTWPAGTAAISTPSPPPSTTGHV
jgi:transposase-like protein